MTGALDVCPKLVCTSLNLLGFLPELHSAVVYGKHNIMNGVINTKRIVPRWKWQQRLFQLEKWRDTRACIKPRCWWRLIFVQAPTRTRCVHPTHSPPLAQTTLSNSKICGNLCGVCCMCKQSDVEKLLIWFSEDKTLGVIFFSRTSLYSSVAV